MSREEIDRILKSDLTYLDHTIDKKINSIEQITGHLSEKTNFLAEFQKMLQRELTSMKNGSLEEKVSIKQDMKQEEVGVARQRQGEGNLHGEQELTLIEASSQCREQQVLHVEEMEDSIEEFTPKADPHLWEQPRWSNGRMAKHLNAVKMELEQFKLIVSLLKEQIKAEVDYFKQIVVRDFQHSFTQALAKQSQQYGEQVQLLLKQIDSLKQQVASLKQPPPKVQPPKFEPVKDVFADITFKKLSEQNSLNMTQRLREYESSLLKNPRSSTPKANELPNSDQWKTYRVNLQQNVEPPARFRAKMQKETYMVPQTKILTVGVPPTRNGFGVLKIGNKVIYKGMWKDGKFEGSGWLNWEDYCYEGMFSAGCFEGHGRLQFKEAAYVGKFEGNKAEGEGTLEMGGKKIMGIWCKNRLVRMF